VKERPLQDRFTFWFLSALVPGATDVEVRMKKGAGIVSGSTKIGDHTLEPPRCQTRIGTWPLEVYEALARLCITYKDVFGRKHLSVFDYGVNDDWVQVAFVADIEQDLADLERVILDSAKPS
jgi:hypothetical protein